MQKIILGADLTREMKHLDPEGVADAIFAMGKSFEWLKDHLAGVWGVELTKTQEEKIRCRMKWLERKERRKIFNDSSILEK